MSRLNPVRRPDPVEDKTGPPNDAALERAAIGCVLVAAALGSQAQVDAILEGLHPGLFYNGQPRLALQACREIRSAGHALDSVTFSSWAHKHHTFGDHAMTVSVLAWSDDVPSPLMWTTYREQLEDLRRRRELLRLAITAKQLVNDPAIDPAALRREFAEMLDGVAASDRASARKPVEFLQVVHHAETQLRNDLCLVGNSDVTKGYEGIMVIGGPPGSGKSLAAMSLGIAGAVGKGYWMGRKVHRQFHTMVIQSENGSIRLQSEFREMLRYHADLRDDLAKFMRISKPPEGGLPFHRPDFRRELARAIEEFAPDVVILDPWTAVAAEDSSKDIMDKLSEIRSVLPPGDECPALVIVAHTRKPRPENGQARGRSLMYSVSGSQALVATARCVQVLFPFTDDIQDDRVLWACAKLSNGEAAADTVWHRKLGTFFTHCTDDPEEFWKPKDKEEDRWLTPQMVKKLLGNGSMTMNRLATTAADAHNNGRGASTVHKWLKAPEFAQHLDKAGGLVSWKD